MNHQKPRLGYVGLGIMGAAMAKNLLDAGYALSVWNRTPEKAQALVAAGAALCESAAQVAGESDVVFVNVTDTPDVEQVLFSVMGVAAGAEDGLIVVDHSTISPTATQRFAERLGEYHITLLDAPVSGGDVGARAGTLSVMVGGPPEAFGVVRPMLEVVGAAVAHVGGVGMGQACKACNQVAGMGALLAVAEAMALAKKLGLDPAKMIEVVSAGASGSWQLENLGPKIAAGDHAPGFMVDLAIKDLGIIQDTARELKLPTAVAALAEMYFRAVSAGGGGRLGTQAIARTFELLGGFTFAQEASEAPTQ